MNLDGEALNQIFDVLVNVCGASEHDRDDFMLLQSEPNPPREYRFMGKLGYGGKFWRDKDRIYVNCYPEDETPVRKSVVVEANKLLNDLKV